MMLTLTNAAKSTYSINARDSTVVQDLDGARLAYFFTSGGADLWEMSDDSRRVEQKLGAIAMRPEPGTRGHISAIRESAAAHGTKNQRRGDDSEIGRSTPFISKCFLIYERIPLIR